MCTHLRNEITICEERERDRNRKAQAKVTMSRRQSRDQAINLLKQTSEKNEGEREREKLQQYYWKI